MAHIYKVPLVLTPQPEGGYVLTSPVLPELITEGDTVEEAVENVEDAVKAVIEIYEDLGKPLPANLRQDSQADSIWFEYVVSACGMPTRSGSGKGWGAGRHTLSLA